MCLVRSLFKSHLPILRFWCASDLHRPRTFTEKGWSDSSTILYFLLLLCKYSCLHLLPSLPPTDSSTGLTQIWNNCQDNVSVDGGQKLHLSLWRLTETLAVGEWQQCWARVGSPAWFGWNERGILALWGRLSPKKKRGGTDSNMPGLFSPNVQSCVPFLLWRDWEGRERPKYDANGGPVTWKETFRTGHSFHSVWSHS